MFVSTRLRRDHSLTFLRIDPNSKRTLIFCQVQSERSAIGLGRNDNARYDES